MKYMQQWMNATDEGYRCKQQVKAIGSHWKCRQRMQATHAGQQTETTAAGSKCKLQMQPIAAGYGCRLELQDCSPPCSRMLALPLYQALQQTLRSCTCGAALQPCLTLLRLLASGQDTTGDSTALGVPQSTPRYCSVQVRLDHSTAQITVMLTLNTHQQQM